MKTGLNRLVGLTVLVFVVLALTQVFTGEISGERCTTGVVLYIYGMTTCPYCERLHEFLGANYPNLTTFCAIDRVQSCDSAFSKQTEVLLRRFNASISLSTYILHRLFTSVPRTLIVKDRTHILAVVVGLVENTDFWNNLTCLEPSSKIPLFYGTTEIGYIDIDVSEQPSLLREWIVDNEPKQQAGSPMILVALVIIAVAGLLVLLVALKLTRKS